MRIFVLEGDLNNSIEGLRSHLIKKICDNGNDVTIWGGKPYKSNFGETIVDPVSNFKIMPLSVNTLRPLFVIKAIFKLMFFSICNKPDYFLVFNIRPILIWGFCNRFLKIKSIATVTGTITYRNEKGFNNFYEIILNFCLKGYDNIVFQNEYDYHLFQQIGYKLNQGRILIEGSGVDVNFFVNDNTKIKKWDFIFIGRLLKQKGIIEFLQASNRLIQKYPKLRIAIVGPVYLSSMGDSKLIFSEIEDYFIHDRILYLGESKNVKNILSESKALVLPSYGEGLSNVLLEAASMGLPLIATNVPGCKEVVKEGHNGFLCNVLDSYDLELKMEKFINMNEQKKSEMGRESREIAISRFSKERVIKQYFDILNLN
jgi:glycosyltransferase involved in cell wall biosynthesis